jgi:uncharacterized protein YhbP (UPF0306 family)
MEYVGLPFQLLLKEGGMKKLTVAMMLLVVFSFGFAKVKTENVEVKSSQSVSGYLVDKMCGQKMTKLDEAKATEKAMKHTKDCAIEDMCKEDGYGVVSNGKFIKFDENGDKLALAYFDKSKKDKDFMVDVEGTMDGDIMKVASINDVQEKAEKSEMKSEHTMSGYMLDVACGTKMSKLDEDKAMEKAKGHTKDCALQDACKASGYGIIMKGKLIKFDENGNKLASEYFDKTKKEKGFWVDVRGTMDGDMIKVESIKDVKAKVKKAVQKKEEKQG